MNGIPLNSHFVGQVESLVAQNNDGYRSTKANRQRIADQLKIDRVMGTILMRAAYDGQDLTAGSPYLVLGDVVEEVRQQHFVPPFRAT